MVIGKIFLSLFLLIGSMGNIKTTPIMEQISKAADFEVLLPHYSMRSWKMEVKNPYPLDLSKAITRVRLHYFNKSGESYAFGIEQHKALGYRSKREQTNIDISNNTQTPEIMEEDFKFNTRGELVKFNGVEARFEAWANGMPGGYLRWIQNGTYVEIDSMTMPKKYMIKLAKSIN